MTAVTRRSTSSVVFGVLAALLLATNVSAAPPTWTSPITVRTTNGPELTDADFSGRNVAIAWDEPDSPREVRLRTSTNSGSSFGPMSVFGGSRQAAVEICGGAELNAAMAHNIGPDNWVIEHAQSSVDGDTFLTTPVAPTDGLQNNPDVACASGRVFVSWFEKEGGGDRLFIAHAKRTGGGFSSPIDLGFDSETDFFSGLALAGADNMAYAVFRRSSGDLRFRSWSVGGGPNFPVNANPAQIIDQATPNHPAFLPVIDALGSKVAVAWMTCEAVVARVSTDWGQTWGPIRTLIEHGACDGDFIAAPNSIAINGSRIALEYSAFGIFGNGDEGLIRTTNNFASFSDDNISTVGHFMHLVGYVQVGGHTKLAAAFQRLDNVRFRRQI